jgi:hypothetical protein
MKEMIGNSGAILTAFAASIIFSGSVFAGDEILLRDFEQIPQSDGVRNVSQSEGVNGLAANFNGYTSEWEETGLSTVPKTLFVEAWVCPREYSFDKSAFVNQMDSDWKGFFLGINYRGEAVACFYAGDKRHDCVSPESLPLAKWSHVAVAYREGAGIELSVNGKSVAKTLFEEPLLIPPQTPLVIGKTQAKSLAVYTSPQGEQYKVWMRFNGLMDELKITGTVPDETALQSRIAATGKSGVKGLNLPQFPSADIPQGAFGAYYTRLRYGVKEWESLWRVGEHPDIVVRFPDLPTKFIFWRGANYLPAIVTENDIWICEQGVEGWKDECFEPMSDNQCRYSHVRIIENTPARCVVHWRYPRSNSRNQILNEDETGWGDWVDEYWTVYPDGVAVRKQTLHTLYYEQKKYNTQFQQLTPLNQPGTRNEDNLEYAALTFADMDGDTASYSWEKEVPEAFPEPKYKPVQLLNTKSKYRPFHIYNSDRVTVPTSGKTYENGSAFRMWSHWPLGQIKSFNIDAVRGDKPSHTNLEQFDSETQAVEYGPDHTVTARQMIGATTQQILTLLPLARSWNNPPKLELKSDGFENRGYDVFQRAYLLRKETSQNKPLRFVLNATEQSPVHNICIILENADWPNAAISLNGKKLSRGKDYQTGLIQGLDESQTVLWLPASSSVPVEITVNAERKARNK